MRKNGEAAAFYDLEGTLVSTNLVHTLGFYARRQQGNWLAPLLNHYSLSVKLVKDLQTLCLELARTDRFRFVFHNISRILNDQTGDQCDLMKVS